VFSGERGRYTEDDLPDANDSYGIAKFLGEVDEPNVITLRTSIIGQELNGKDGLLEWFLSQSDQCRCYTKAIFSGFPTVVLAQLVRDVILPLQDLHGIYHVATQPISKFELLQLIAQRYGKSIYLEADDKVSVDRSLLAERFAKATGYVPPTWPELINSMFSYQYGLEKS
jgi:dTDP-4-dehydrorhamnose reductase